jgi:chromosome segregation ATPase
LRARFTRGLYSIPGIDKIVGKLEIAYNQLWINGLQKNVLGTKEEVGRLNSKINSREQSKRGLESAIESWERDDIPGVESLRSKLSDVNSEIEKLLNAKNDAESRLGAQNNDMLRYTNERDRVAHRFIRRYEAKLAPIDEKLKTLRACGDKVDLLIAVADARHQEQLAELADREKKLREKVEDALRKSGMSEGAIATFEAIRGSEQFFATTRKEIEVERERLAKEKARIDREIARVAAMADSYMDKRDEFVRITNRGLVEVDTTARQRENAKPGERREMQTPQIGGTTPYESASTAPVDSGGGAKQERVEDGERLTTGDYIDRWNKFWL